VVIPVELTGFTATLDGDKALLRWQTASETDNAGFEVQYRAPGSGDDRPVHFKRLGFVEGAGTTGKPRGYRFRTNRLGVGTHAFRLRQVDLDGTSVLTESVEVRVQMKERYALRAYPNPTMGPATVQVALREGGPMQVTVYDLLGRQVARLFDGDLPAGEVKRIVVDTKRLASGLYVVRLRGAGVSASERLVVR
jgi:hypothetical protein